MVAMLGVTRRAHLRRFLPVLSRLLAASLLGAVALAPPAAAQQGTIASFDVNVLTGAVTAVGGKSGQSAVENGKAYHTLTLPSGIPAVAYFDDCEGQVCKSLVLISSLPMPAGRTVVELDEMLRQVNNNVPSAKVFRVNDRVVMQHYVLADFGIAAQNLQEHLKAFSNVTASMYNTLNPKPAQ
jgi:hypothetical protein